MLFQTKLGKVQKWSLWSIAMTLESPQKHCPQHKEKIDDLEVQHNPSQRYLSSLAFTFLQIVLVSLYKQNLTYQSLEGQSNGHFSAINIMFGSLRWIPGTSSDIQVIQSHLARSGGQYQRDFGMGRSDSHLSQKATHFFIEKKVLCV